MIRDTKLLWQDYTQAFLNAEVREGEQLYTQPPEAWNPKFLTDGRRVVWRVRKAMLQNISETHLSGKLREHGFVQDERDPFLFVNTELNNNDNDSITKQVTRRDDYKKEKPLPAVQCWP